MHNGEEEIPVIPTHQEVAADVMGRYRELGRRYWGWVTVLASLFLLGVVGFVIRLADGFDDRSNWGYHVATISFLVSTFMAMPIISAGLRLAKANWRRSFTRVTENMAVASLLIALMIIPALAALPPLKGRMNIWFEFPLGAPNLWNMMAFGTLALIGIAFLWTLALPDLAAARDHLAPSRRQRIVRWMAMGWVGHVRQWRVLYMGSMIMGAFYMLFYPLIQTLMISDFHAGLLPAWKDAILPATQIVASLQAASGMTLVIMYVMRRVAGYDRYFTVEQFWSLAKPLLSFSLLWFYFWWASFITFWYGRQPGESTLMQFLILDSWRGPMMVSFFLNFLGPLIALVWNPVRRSIWGPALVGAGIVVGALINQIRLYVAAFSVADPTQRVLDPIPPGQWPGPPDVLIVIGAISGCLLLFMLVSKLIPIISIWEINEGLTLVKVRKFYGRYLRVIAKSH
jgi:molybdopterin-containing oxidoreductase family membrane subunit